MGNNLLWKDLRCLLLNFILNHPHIFQISVDLFFLWDLFEKSSLLPRIWTKTVEVRLAIRNTEKNNFWLLLESNWRILDIVEYISRFFMWKLTQKVKCLSAKLNSWLISFHQFLVIEYILEDIIRNTKRPWITFEFHLVTGYLFMPNLAISFIQQI